MQEKKKHDPKSQMSVSPANVSYKQQRSTVRHLYGDTSWSNENESHGKRLSQSQLNDNKLFKIG